MAVVLLPEIPGMIDVSPMMGTAMKSFPALRGQVIEGRTQFSPSLLSHGDVQLGVLIAHSATVTHVGRSTSSLPATGEVS